MIRIFLAHAKEDESAVVALYERLKQNGYHPWLDKEDLLPGQNWRAEIPKAIKESDVFIACFSNRSTTKSGYVQREFRMALNEYASKPPNSIYFIHLRLDNCKIPDLRQDDYGVNLRDIHWVDIFEADGFSRLVAALEDGFPDIHKQVDNVSLLGSRVELRKNRQVQKAQSSELQKSRKRSLRLIEFDTVKVCDVNKGFLGIGKSVVTETLRRNNGVVKFRVTL